MNLDASFNWQGHSSDRNDEQFGDVIESVGPDEAGEFDAVLVGEPFDGAVIGRAGAREGPAAIRESLASVKTHHFDAGPVASLGDLGDIEVPAGESVSAVQERVRDVATEVHDTDTLPVFLGGDNSLTYANVAGLLEARALADGGYVTDGGFGEDDEETVGDVEHFDPTGSGREDDGAVEGGTDEADTEESEETDETQESEEEPEQVEETEEEPEQVEETEEEPEQVEETEEEPEQAEETEEEPEEGEETEETEELEETEEKSEQEIHSGEAEPEADESAAETPPESGDDTDTETENHIDPDSVGTTETVVDSGQGSNDEGAAGSREQDSSEGGSTDGEKVGVVSLDAHLDCREVDGQPTNGSPYRQLFEAGLDSLAVVGARHFETSTADAEFLREQGGEIVTAEEVGADPVEAADRALDAMAGVDTVYLSVDMDVLDATAGPGVSAPTPGGITTRELFRLVRLLASDDRLAGIEVVETAPPLCPDSLTADAGARVVAHALSAAGGRHG